jgi:hypothetical protein
MTESQKSKLKKELLNNPNNFSVGADEIIRQIETFEKGIPFVQLIKPCKINDGIKLLDADQKKQYKELYNKSTQNKVMMKFVPASGAASRMFKKLQAVLLNDEQVTLTNLKTSNDENSKAALEFISNIEKFAFYDELKKIMAADGLDLVRLKKEGRCSDIIRYSLNESGLNYTNKPKGSIKFHNYPEGARTAFEEHLIEAVNYSTGKNNTAKVHFTISEEHTELFESIVLPAVEKYKINGNVIDVDYSFQKQSTDTIAVTKDNEPFRDETGKILFRPGGHGALLENLNDLDADVIFIKNIDNVAPDHLKTETYNYKKILCGYLIELQNKIFSYLSILEELEHNDAKLNAIAEFCKDELEIDLVSDFNHLNADEKRKYLFSELNRPLRVCGMVVNEGHPGGGPFWIKDREGRISKQVIETTQVDLKKPDQKKIIDSATHFSPVDLVCGIKSYKGDRFNLKEFTDPDSGLIVTKSYEGKELKALELPGLWNGGMAKWISIFVEVPKITFTPVKEVNDLLKEEHQPLG